MELQEMKNLWQNSSAENIPENALQQMISVKKHTLIRKIKIQLLLEIVLWIMIICVYHNAFDGDKRSAVVNLIFVTGILQAITYNLSGYFATRNLIQGSDLVGSIEKYIKKLQQFRWAVIISRTVLMIWFLVFFMYSLELNNRRLVFSGAILFVFILQLWIIYGSWTNRIAKLSSIANEFK